MTIREEKKRAEVITRVLGDNKLRNSNGRSIGIDAVKPRLRLEFEDYFSDRALTRLIREYNDLICHYIGRQDAGMFLHTRYFILLESSTSD